MSLLVLRLIIRRKASKMKKLAISSLEFKTVTGRSAINKLKINIL
jgi:hypothetical protein